MLEQLHFDTFEQYVNQNFSLSYRNTAVATLELISVRTKPAAARNEDQRTPFSLIFRSKDNSAISDGSFTFRHDEIGQLENVFVNRILPIEPDDTAPHYQVIFN